MMLVVLFSQHIRSVRHFDVFGRNTGRMKKCATFCCHAILPLGKQTDIFVTCRRLCRRPAKICPKDGSNMGISALHLLNRAGASFFAYGDLDQKKQFFEEQAFPKHCEDNEVLHGQRPQKINDALKTSFPIKLVGYPLVCAARICWVGGTLIPLGSLVDMIDNSSTLLRRQRQWASVPSTALAWLALYMCAANA